MKQQSLYQIENLIQFFPRGKEQLIQHDFTYRTKKITFNMHYRHKLISIERLNEFQVEDKEKGCKHIKPCNNFGKCYSCPPIAKNLSEYNYNYTHCLIYAFWCDWNFKLASDNPYFKLVNANRTLSPLAFNYGRKLERMLGGKDMIDGRCPLCIKCKASLTPKQPCAFPKERRSSLEAVGLDASLLSEQILEHPISWYLKKQDKIIEPKYLTVIHGLLTNSQQPKEMIK